MRNPCILLFIIVAGLSQKAFGQCDFVVPPSVKKINIAAREFTFSEVTINGKKTTYLAVKKGEKVKVSTKVKSRKKGSYCPSCIVQVYWGIRGHASECAKSFYGYNFNEKRSKLTFSAPMKDGIYYITMGHTLDYSCKNNLNRPSCSPDYAFAVLKVGNPDPKQQVAFELVTRGGKDYLKSKLIKPGCFGKLDELQWYFQGKELAYQGQEEIPLKRKGKYKVVYSNCKTSFSSLFRYSGNGRGLAVNQQGQADNKQIVVKLNQNNKQDADREKGTVLEEKIKSMDRFVLENLIFDLGKSIVKPEARSDLNELVAIMKRNRSMKIRLEGHTDKRGSSRKNLILSEERVEAVKEYLVSRGIGKDRIETKGWGDQKPLVVTNDVNKGQVNRRVEVKILSR